MRSTSSPSADASTDLQGLVSDNRYGFFPAASAGWIITQEDFMAGIKNVLSYLKVRASYGITGNSGIPDYAHLALYTGVNYAGRNGLEATQLAEPVSSDGKILHSLDIGLDFGFFSNRITGEIDYYQKKTTDLLLYRTLACHLRFYRCLEQCRRT